ncbi:MAG: TlpA family protein disulfide reductase [SAR324 cluster bacterium]|nr:TlpA family protein disulfide reductase [SAR324 cluster bacterium]
MHQDYAAKGLKIVAINVAISDPVQRVKKFIESQNTPVTVVVDSKRTVSKDYRMSGTPYVVLIDATGNIVETGRSAPVDAVKALMF